MPSTASYLQELVKQREQLALNLVTMGVEADPSEKFSTLVPKVLEIKVGGEMPHLYPIEIKLSNTNLSITDTSNGKFGDGYIIYTNGAQLYRFESQDDIVGLDLLDIEFPYVGDHTISAIVYDNDNFNNSAMSNEVLYRMPGYYFEDETTIKFQVDYREEPMPWYPSGKTAILI